MIHPERMIYSLKTPKFNDMFGYYRELLGEPETSSPEKWATFQLPGAQLVLWSAVNFIPVDGGVQICFVVEDLEHTLSALNLSGMIQEASHGRECFISDPDGNTLILYQPAPAKTDDNAR